MLLQNIEYSSLCYTAGPCQFYFIFVVVVESLQHVRLFAILWTVAGQASLSMEFSRQEYWSG